MEPDSGEGQHPVFRKVVVTSQRHILDYQDTVLGQLGLQAGTWAPQYMQALNDLHHPLNDKEGGSMFGLDFETYGTRDLRTVGLDNYLSDPEFRPLIAAVYDTHVDDGRVYDFLTAPDDIQLFRQTIHGVTLVAFNAGFERGVLAQMKASHLPTAVIDAAVTARCMGAGSALAQAAPQLLGTQKMAEGKALIEKFSKPTKDGRCLAQDMADAGTLASDPDWIQFKEYCLLDAKLGAMLQVKYGSQVTSKERRYELLTHEMNQVGWKVDLAAVHAMKQRYETNLADELADFQRRFDAKDLNFNSSMQLKKWCAERGIRASSFDERSVENLIRKIIKKLDTMSIDDLKRDGYFAVLQMLKTKKTLGGSSLKKLKVILDTVSEDGRLRNQYMHVGAGQTYRTSGRGVQMQNLKRLRNVRDMSLLHLESYDWTNEELAENLRQVFTASTPYGELIVGDFSSVESRGLAMLAGASWKVNAFSQGQDMYKVLASKIYGVPYDQVTKPQRQTGKVGELSCGYGAGPAAVQSFATGMGVDMSEEDATVLVRDWRTTNPEVVQFWGNLDEMLDKVLAGGDDQTLPILGPGWHLSIGRMDTPKSLLKLHPGAISIEVRVIQPYGGVYLTRVFHGCYRRGRQISYYKPSALVSGDSWSSSYMDPKTKTRKYYSIYGGKLTGILTQSLCREIFFESLWAFAGWAEKYPNVKLVGQFHDEIVVDYTPGPNNEYPSLDDTVDALEDYMSKCTIARFPLSAEVKHDYRYIK